ncbi:hypothetical protein JHK82_052697 [Glycine max]|nr:hypothetical protein JHK86_052545 [Glycine max]KAG4926906.1 hypothetical protein JHK85_053392 [Glycine max]KAG5082545.1 hypothetical protein JHK84_052583 [Glycine max]KAG5085300.1 hypothetical protein JHK82_052697 [Glycine max]
MKMEALSSSKTQPKTKEKSGTEEDTKMKKKEWKQRKQIGGQMTQMKEAAGDFEFVPPLEIVEYPNPRLRARNKRIVAFDDCERGEEEEIVLVNPRVSQYTKNLTLFNEGCLSFPVINAGVKPDQKTNGTQNPSSALPTLFSAFPYEQNMFSAILLLRLYFPSVLVLPVFSNVAMLFLHLVQCYCSIRRLGECAVGSSISVC